MLKCFVLLSFSFGEYVFLVGYRLKDGIMNDHEGLRDTMDNMHPVRSFVCSSVGPFGPLALRARVVPILLLFVAKSGKETGTVFVVCKYFSFRQVISWILTSRQPQMAISQGDIVEKSQDSFQQALLRSA